MVSYYSCDACGNPIDRSQRVHSVGHAIKREYCDICAPLVDGYMLALEEARKEASRSYVDARDRLMAEIAKRSPGIRLPDTIYDESGTRAA